MSTLSFMVIEKIPVEYERILRKSLKSFVILGKVPLARSKTHKDPFENGHEDIFEFEDMDVGEPRKIK